MIRLQNISVELCFCQLKKTKNKNKRPLSKNTGCKMIRAYSCLSESKMGECGHSQKIPVHQKLFKSRMFTFLELTRSSKWPASQTLQKPGLVCCSLSSSSLPCHGWFFRQFWVTFTHSIRAPYRYRMLPLLMFNRCLNPGYQSYRTNPEKQYHVVPARLKMWDRGKGAGLPGSLIWSRAVIGALSTLDLFLGANG